SSSSTRLAGSALRRLARTDPADPDPPITKSYLSPTTGESPFSLRHKSCLVATYGLHPRSDGSDIGLDVRFAGNTTKPQLARLCRFSLATNLPPVYRCVTCATHADSPCDPHPTSSAPRTSEVHSSLTGCKGAGGKTPWSDGRVAPVGHEDRPRDERRGVAREEDDARRDLLREGETLLRGVVDPEPAEFGPVHR